MDEINSGMEEAPTPLQVEQRLGEVADTTNVTTLVRLGARAFAIDYPEGIQRWRAISRVKPASA